MPFISGPSGSDGIPIETDSGVKEFDAVSSNGTIKAGAPIEMVDVFTISDAHIITGINDYRRMVAVGDGRILGYSTDTNKIYLFQLSDNSLQLKSSTDIPSSLTMKSSESTYNTEYVLKVISDSTAVFVKSSYDGILCAALSFTYSTVVIGTPYTISSYDRMTNCIAVKLDSSHILVPSDIKTESFDFYPVFNVLTISGTNITKSSSLQITEQTTYGGYMEMYALKDYVLAAWHPDSGYSSSYHISLKFKNSLMTLCGTPILNAVIADDPYVSENTLYTFKSVTNGTEGYQVTCSDSGVDANYSYVYKLYTQVSSGNKWFLPDNTDLLSTSIGTINITKNTNLHVGQFSSYESYVIFKDAMYKYSMTSSDNWKSLVLYRQFVYMTSTNRYHGTYPRFSIDDNHIFASNFGDTSSNTLTYTICTIRPTVKVSTYIADGIAATDITSTSGKCALF